MNTHPILVASIADGTGKTAVTLALARLEQERGRSVGYMKPKGTRLQSSTGKTLDRDPLLARELLGLDGEIHQLEPVVYSPTFVDGAIRGREDPAELGDVVEDRFRELAADVDLMLVEGGGDWTTGGIVDLTDVDVADRLDASVLLVATYGTGADLDRVLAAADAFGDRLAGVLFNNVSDAAFDDLESDAVPFLERRGVPVVGVLPHDRDLAGVTVDDLAGELGADVVVEGDGDAHIERFLIGAMGGDAALRYFRRTKDAAVVTGGDRPEIITAALEAPGVNAIVLTGGHRPSAAVLGTAETRGVPVLLASGDTLSVVERAESLLESGHTRDAGTVTRMRDLLHDHADIDAILGHDGSAVDAGPGSDASASSGSDADSGSDGDPDTGSDADSGSDGDPDTGSDE